MNARAGGFTIVLHTHLPWVLHHGRWPHGSDWLCEAVAECYLPLVAVLESRARPGTSLGITLSLSPVLCEQLAHPDFAGEFRAYALHRRAAAREDARRFAAAGRAAEAALARRWRDGYDGALAQWNAAPGLLARFARLESLGAIELIACAASHAYLPLLATPAAVRRQVAVAVESHRRHFGRPPLGMWLPECAYRPDGPWTSPLADGAAEAWRPGLERVLAEHGIRYFFVETHLVDGGAPLEVFSGSAGGRARGRRAARASAMGPAPGAPRADRAYRAGTSPVAVFGRDAATSRQVWSREGGYPGDPAYREFHRRHHPGGLRYWAVTDAAGDLPAKRLYDPAAASLRARAHAEHLLAGLAARFRAAGRAGAPRLCAMYDTELFGHWWWEGPEFLAGLLDLAPGHGVPLATPGAWLDEVGEAPPLALPEGSWGAGGGHSTWLDARTRPLWAEVHAVETGFEAVARRALGRAGGPIDRLLAQALREVLLAEASDWPFLVTHGTARDYAEARLEAHARDARRLLAIASTVLDRGPHRAAEALAAADEAFVAACERRDPPFAWLDWRSGLVPAESASAALRPRERAAPAPAARAASPAPARPSRRGRESSAGSFRSRAARRRRRGAGDS